MARLMRIVVIAGTLFLCVGCDQATKALAKEFLPRNQVLSFAHDTFRLHYTENTGAFLSLGSALPEKARMVLFTAGNGVILLGILGFLLFAPVLPSSATVFLALVAGGGLSNLIDRIAYGGSVVDFLNIGIGSLRTGIFNIADVAIMAGVVGFIAISLWHERMAGS